MNITKTQINAILVAMAALTGTAYAAIPANLNEATSFNQTQVALSGLSIGNLPAGIQTVVANLSIYRNTELIKNAGLVLAKDNAVTSVNTQQTAINTQVALINGLILANPLDPQILVEQATLAGQQSTLVTLQGNLATAAANVTNSDTKIALYTQAINNPVAAAQTAAANAALAITAARNQFAAGANPANSNYAATGTAGLQSVVDVVSNVAAGDQVPVTTAITAADSVFAGIGANNATLLDIQNLVGVINTQLPTLPPISQTDKDAALASVLNGSYERAAILANTSAVTTEVSARTSADTVLTNAVISEASSRTSADAVLTSGLSTELSTRASADAVLTSGLSTEVSARTSADAVLTSGLSTELSTRASADAVLTSGLSTEVSNRASADVVLNNAVVAEAATRTSADVVLTSGLSTEVSTRASADVVLTSNLSAERTRALAAEGLLDDRTTALEGRMGNAERNIKTLRKGVAMAAALQTPVINEGDDNAIKVGAAGFDGESGLAIGYARRINESVTVNAELATGFPDVIARGGVNYSF